MSLTDGTTWTAHKFGGTSLADADAFGRAADIVLDTGSRRQAVTVSATAGTTDRLLRLVENARQGVPFERELKEIETAQAKIAIDLLGDLGAETSASIADDCTNLASILDTIGVMKTSPTQATSTVAGYGELWSARILTKHLTNLGVNAAFLDAREVLYVTQTGLVPVVDWPRSETAFAAWFDATQPEIAVAPGFIASDERGTPVTLGRNGSDLSASIFARLFEADSLIIWTDVDGVMTADPGLVPAAQVVERMSYDEAMELAYFGAKVIHPWTMGPVMGMGIPIVIRNAFDPSSPGTTIGVRSDETNPIKGFASVGDIALINLEGTAMIGVPGISERVFGALRSEGVSVMMISQASSEHSICFAVPEPEAALATSAVSEVFSREKSFGHVKEVEVTQHCTILAAVGDGMSGTPGIAARLFSSLARIGVNIRAIAQGSSERNISVVIDSSDAVRALRSAHSGFYLSEQTLSIGLIGPGHVGAKLLDQMADQHQLLRDEHGIDMRVRAIARSNSMLLDELGIELGSWRDRLGDPASTVPTDIDMLTGYVHTETVPHAVIIDCTAESSVAERYADWLESGIHVITPNKKASSGDWSYYEKLGYPRDSSTHFLYETTVGAALPVLQTLRDLVRTGDTVYRIEGVLSGTLSYLFNTFDGSIPFSQIVRDAREQGFTEPDPREDLSGMDVARKVVILAREMGMHVDLSELEVEGLVPDRLASLSVEDFVSEYSTEDSHILDMFEDAKANGEVLRFVGVVDAEHGCEVSLRRYDVSHPFAGTTATDNIIRFETARYKETPLVIRGPGAGPDLTAGGVFADLLRLASNLGARL